jgi:hypothetical protein
VSLVALLVPTAATADRHKAGFGGNATRASGSSLWGVGFSAELVLNPGSPSPRPWTFGVTLEASQVAGIHEDGDLGEEGELSRTAILPGLRVTRGSLISRQVQPFVHLLGGFAYERGTLVDPRTSFAWGSGVGVDILPFGADDEEWFVARVQYGWQRLRGDWYGQFSVGLVFRVE